MGGGLRKCQNFFLGESFLEIETGSRWWFWWQVADCVLAPVCLVGGGLYSVQYKVGGGWLLG